MYDILYLINTRNKGSPRVRVALPKHLLEQLMQKQHRGLMGAHISGSRLFGVLSSQWWWRGIHVDAVRFARNCPECTNVSGGGRVCWSPLHLIPVKRPFLIFWKNNYCGSSNHSTGEQTCGSVQRLPHNIATGVSRPRPAFRTTHAWLPRKQSRV